MSNLIKIIFRFIFFIVVQQFVLFKVPPLHQFITPYLYFLFILWLPFSLHKMVVLLLSFLIGISLDYFTGTLGLHAAPCVLIGFLRPYILSLLNPHETNEISLPEPSAKSMTLKAYLFYIFFFTIIHNFYLVFIEWLQFGNFVYFISKVAASVAVSLLLILVIEILFNRKATYRTNTA